MRLLKRQGASPTASAWTRAAMCAVLALLAQQASAATLAMSNQVMATGGIAGALNNGAEAYCATTAGAGTLTSNTGTGCDYSATDAIVRTNDLIRYRVSYSINGGSDTNVRITSTLPVGFRFDTLPGFCLVSGVTPASSLSVDGRTLVCNLGSKATGTAEEPEFFVKVAGAADATTLAFSATIQGDASAAVAQSAPAVTVTAAPRVSARIGYYPRAIGNVVAPGISTYAPLSVSTFVNNVTLFVDNRDGKALLGHAALTSTISVQMTLGNITPGTAVFPQYYPSGCSPVQYGNGPNGGYTDRVLQAGACAATLSGNVLTVTITGADTSGWWTPTTEGGGAPIQTGMAVIGSYAPVLAVPWSEIDAAVAPTGDGNGSLTITATLNNSTPALALSGTTAAGVQNNNAADTLSDNSNSGTIYVTAPGLTCRTTYFGPSTSQYSNPYGSPGQDGPLGVGQLTSVLSLANVNGTGSLTNVKVCTVLDTGNQTVRLPIEPNAKSLASALSSLATANNGAIVNPTMEFASGYVGVWPTSGIPASPAAGQIEQECSDSVAWKSDPTAVVGPITKFRLRADKVMSGTSLEIPIDVYGTVPNTSIATWESCSSNEFPAWTANTTNPRSTAYGSNSPTSLADRVFIVSAIARISKVTDNPSNDSASNPATLGDDSINSTSPGQSLRFYLKPTLVAGTGVTGTSRLTITDTLPAGLSFAGSTQNGATLVPSSVSSCTGAGAPVASCTAAGQTVVVWDLGLVAINSVIPPIVVDTVVLATATGTLTNTAVIYSPDDFVSASSRTATRSVSVNQLPGLTVSKSVNPVFLQPPGGNVTYGVNYLNNTGSVVNQVVIIDVLPFVGDGRTPATTYNGSRVLNAISGLPAGVSVEYTKTAAASVNSDPTVASNAPGGSTVWCLVLSGGSCPASLSEVTAVRFTDVTALPNGSSRSYSFSVNVTPTASNLSQVLSNSVGGDSDVTVLAVQSRVVTTTIVSTSLSGRVYEDLNANGAFNAGEPGVAGVCVTISGTGTSIGNDGPYSMRTAADGTYSFALGAGDQVFASADCSGTAIGAATYAGVRPGTWSVAEVQPAGFTNSTPSANVGSAGGAAGADTVSGITLSIGTMGANYNFGEIRQVTTVAGRVYREGSAPANTADDGNTVDPGLAGVQLSISCTGPTFTAGPVTTAADGGYSFANVPALANCTITQTQPVGYVSAYNVLGTGATSQTGSSGIGNSTIVLTVPVGGSTGNSFAESPLVISGTVFNDTNGLLGTPVNTVDGTGTNAGGLFAILVNGSGNVAGSVAVAADGTYAFSNITAGSYTVRLSTTAGTVGVAAPAVSLPSGWVATGEFVGVGAGNDGTPDGQVAVDASAGSVANVNLGLEQPPTATAVNPAPQPNPGVTNQASVPVASFGGSDASAITSYTFPTFPTNTTSVVINGAPYTPGSWPVGGVTVAALTSFTLDPIDGSVTVAVPYTVADAAGKTASASVSVVFTGVSVGGTVFNDVNGLLGTPVNTVDGTGTNAGGLYAILVDGSGNVAASTAVAADGTYLMNNVPAGNYTLRLATTAGTVGSAAPAASLPSGWVTTGEFVGTGPGSDGTPDSQLAVNATAGSVSSANFGIEQPPVATPVNPAAQANLGSTTQATVPVSAFGGSDATAITAYTFPSFPTNTTTVVINGTSYTASSWPAGGVTVASLTSFSVDPVDGSVTVAVPYTVADAAGKTASASVSIAFTGLSVSGTVFNDTNGLLGSPANTVDGTGTNAGGLFAILVDGSGNTAASVAVASDGTYAFANIGAGSYTVRLSTTAGTVGVAAPAVSLPAGWVATGEFVGTGAGSDGTPDGQTSFAVMSASVANVNLGIEQPPTATAVNPAVQPNVGSTTQAVVPVSSFGAADATGITSYTFPTFPTNATTVVINGTSYTAGSWPVGGVTVAALTSFSVDPIDGSVTVSVPYTVADAAGKTASASVNVAFTGLMVSGTVFNDTNGLLGSPSNTVDGTGTNAGALYAVLVDGSGNVVASASVAGSGAYSFPNVAAGSYTVRLSTTAGTVGAAAPAVSLPAGWLSTGEFLGTGPGSDGTPDSQLAISVTTASVTAANFGIEQPPAATPVNPAAQPNVGSTTQVSVAVSAFGATDATAITGYAFPTFPINATSVVINGVPYTAGSWPVGGVSVATLTSFTVDPIDGSVTVSVPYTVSDAAGKTASASLSIAFTGLSISGTVFNDTNGLLGTPSNTVDGTGTNAGGLFAVLVDGAGNVAASVAVAADGTFSFANVAAAAYTVRLSTTAGTVGAAAPAVSLPAGWVAIGELLGGGSGSDGTPDSQLAVTLSTTSIAGLKLGIEQPPTATAVNPAPQPNVGSTTQATVPVSAFGAADATGITSYTFSTFPTNATSVVINGTSYTSGSWPVGGVTVGALSSFSVDPIDGSVTVAVPYTVSDAAGKTASASVSIAFTGLSVSGSVLNDTNGLLGAPVNTVDGTGTNAGGLYAVLVDGAGNVAASAAVAADGSYVFSNVAAGSYTVRLATTAGTVGAAAPAAGLPAGWVATGEFVGTGAGSDGTPDGQVAVTVGATSVTGVKLGIEQPPVAANAAAGSQLNPGGTTQVSIAVGTFNATDATGITGYTFLTFPTNATSVVINGTSYTAGSWPVGGVTVAALTSVTVDPVDGSVTVSVPYTVADAAGKTASAVTTISFNGISVSGTVFNDTNGLLGAPANTVDGTGTNAGGLYAILVDGSGNVAASAAVAGTGAYAFNNPAPGSYTVRLSTTAGTVGAAAPAVSLAAGWVATGENVGAGVGSDGTPDGQLAVNATAASVVAANFGIEQPPVATPVNPAVQPNVGSTTQASVPVSSFGAADATAITSYSFPTFPTNATSVVINGTSYTAGSWPLGGVTVAALSSFSVDPVDGSVTVAAPYTVSDAAGKTASASVSVAFTGLSVGGTVFNDTNGLLGGPTNTVDGVGTNAGGLYAILVDASGNVAASTAVAADRGRRRLLQLRQRRRGRLYGAPGHDGRHGGLCGPGHEPARRLGAYGRKRGHWRRQ